MFHPNTYQKVIDLDDKFKAILFQYTLTQKLNMEFFFPFVVKMVIETFFFCDFGL